MSRHEGKISVCVGFSDDMIVFYQLPENQYEAPTIIKQNKVMSFLMETYNAFLTVVSDPDHYDRQWEISNESKFFPAFCSYIKKYPLSTPDGGNPSLEQISKANMMFASYHFDDGKIRNNKRSIPSIVKEAAVNDISITNTYQIISISNKNEIVYFADDIAQVILLAIIYSQHKGLPTFRICEYCRKAFIPKRSDQKYCSNKCRKNDYNLQHPLYPKLDSRHKMILREIEDNPELDNAYKKWKKQITPMYHKVEGDVIGEISYMVSVNGIFSPKQINDLPEVKEFGEFLKNKWEEIKKNG